MTSRYHPWGPGHDPGPCPVDDIPHHLCTAPDDSLLRVAAYRPHVLDEATKRTLAPPEEPPPQTFTTATYKRTLHAPKGKRTPRR